MSHVINGVTHNVNDDDGVFRIDTSTRKIAYIKSGAEEYFDFPVLVKGDHNSECLTFEIPNLIEDHKISDCNLIRIHYINIDSETSAKYEGAHDVPLDKGIPVKTVKIGDKNVEFAEFTWLINRYATQYAGPLSFVIQFACVTETPRTDADTGETTTVLTTSYSWSTLPYDELSISYSINTDRRVDEEFEKEYNEVLFRWHNELEAKMITRITQTTESTVDEGTNVLTIMQGSGASTEFKVQNGSKGLSAYQVANKVQRDNGKPEYASEEEWLDSLKAIGYSDCLKGMTISQDDYNSLSEEEQNRTDFVYIIKDAEIHAHTADTADSATVAAGYTEDGDIAKALNEITDCDERVTTLEDTVYKMLNSPEEITESGSALVEYTIVSEQISGTLGYQVASRTTTVNVPNEHGIFRNVEITSCALSGVTPKAVISDDGKKISFTISGTVPKYSSGTHTCTIEYSYTHSTSEVISAAHAQTADTAAHSQTADTLTLKDYAVYTVTEGEIYIVDNAECVLTGDRLCILHMARIISDDTTAIAHTAMIYVPAPGGYSYSTNFGADNLKCCIGGNGNEWHLEILNSEYQRVTDSYLVTITGL